MIRYITVLLFTLHLGNGAKLGKLRIVNGTTVDIEDYPYQVSLQYHGNHVCGASILNERYVLTASHCLFKVSPSDISIRAGSSYRNKGGIVYTVEKIIIHPNYVEETFQNDVSILKLSSPLKFGRSVQPINLASLGTKIDDGRNAWATGWGFLYDGGPPADQLQAVKLPTISTETCKQYYGDELYPDMFCAGYKEGGKDTCGGDSGGPLVVSGIQIGITSWGQICAQADSPGAYAKLPIFYEYINSIINEN